MRTASLAAIFAIFSGCAQPENLQPEVAAFGSYALIEGNRRPLEPSPEPAGGCAEGCRCNGTGREPTGDGLSDSECRCPDGCKCKAKKAATVASGTVCKTGTCAGWPPKNIAR